MNKKPFKVIALMLVLVQLIALGSISANASAFNGAVNASMTVNQTDANLMTIDGKITANEAWKNVPWSATSMRYAGTADSGFRFKTMWATQGTYSYLYLLIDINDSTPITATGYDWSNDSVKVILDETKSVANGSKIENGALPANNGRYDNTPIWAQRSASGFFAYNNTNGTYKVSEKGNGTGYYVEASIKLHSVVTDGATMKMNVILQDGEKISSSVNNAQSVWSVNDAVWDTANDPLFADHAGTITFSDTMVKNNVDTALVGSVAYLYQTSAANMTIDGAVGTEEAWDAVEWSTENYMIGNDSTKDSFKFKALWAKDSDKAYLYILIDVNDATPLDASTTSYNWANDSIRVLLDEDCSIANGVKYQDGTVPVASRYNTTPLWIQRSAAGFGSYGNKAGTYKVVEKSDGTGYIAECSILLKDASYVEAGAKMRMNVTFQDGENGVNKAQRIWSYDAAAWSAGKTDTTYADHAGTVVFSEKIAGTQDVVNAVGAQLASDAEATSASTSLRIVSSVNGLDFKKVGYAVSLSETNPVIGATNVSVFETETVYTSVTADGMTVAAEDGKYFFSAVINDIANAEFDTDIHIRAYAITGDDTVIYDDTVTLSVNMLLK